MGRSGQAFIGYDVKGGGSYRNSITKKHNTATWPRNMLTLYKSCGLKRGIHCALQLCYAVQNIDMPDA